ncbi:hypothetical protein AAC03nite_11130 [Alicyclobacillus acidoterrestris]|nr:hypothetical protein AAC03nite_11130 [Alicyclobacillus acidoterrestris]
MALFVEHVSMTKSSTLTTEQVESIQQENRVLKQEIADLKRLFNEVEVESEPKVEELETIT